MLLLFLFALLVEHVQAAAVAQDPPPGSPTAIYIEPFKDGPPPNCFDSYEEIFRIALGDVNNTDAAEFYNTGTTTPKPKVS